jgi:hypothetical protein
MAASGYTPILIYASGTATNVPLAANLTSSSSGAELALNYADGKLYYKDSGGVVQLIASKAGASGDVVGPSSATNNALARFDTTTGKLIKNSVGILSDAGVLTGLTGITSSGSITFSSLTSGRVPYATTAGLLTDSANLTFNGTTLTANTLNLTNALGTTYGGTGLTSFTANGVVYASSSSALATGSALVFDGTNLGVGISPSYKLHVSASSEVVSRFSRSGGANALIQISDPTTTTPPYISSYGNDMAFGQYGGSEFGRFTSTGLGIGTSSPSSKLDIVGVTQWQATAGTVLGKLTYSGGEPVVLSTAGLGLNFYTNNAFAAKIDSSGNLGLGVTPSAWSSGKAVEVGNYGNAFWNNGASENHLTTNAYYNSGWKFGGTGYAQKLTTASGQYQFNVSTASGTAGATITFTQAMTLDASGNLLIGTTSASSLAQKYIDINAAANIGINLKAGDVGQGYIYADDAADEFRLAATGASNVNKMTFYTGGSERARIDSSGNMGIGTSSPATKLDVYNSAASGISEIARFRWNNGGSGGGITLANQAGTVLAQIANTSDASGNPLEFSVYNNSTALTKMMTLSGAGNLGLGVTPSAFGSNKAIQVGNSGFPAVIADIGGDAFFGSNAYNDGTWRYKGTYNASLLRQSVGSFAFFTAPSGTAGNAITFTQAMTLDASGRLGISTTSPSAPLDVFNNTGVSTPAARFYINASGNTPSNLQGFAIYNNVSGGFVDTTLVAGNTANTYMAFGIHNGTSYSERARIDSSGNVGIGTTSPTNLLHLAGSSATPSLRLASTSVGYYWDIGRENATTGDFVFNNASGGSSTEKARITTNGRLGIGTSSPNYNFVNYAQTAQLTATPSSSGFGTVNITNGTAIVNNSTVDVLLMRNANGTVMNGSYSGHVYIVVSGTGGSNDYSAVYYLNSCSNGSANAVFGIVGVSATRGTSPVSSVNMVSDGSGGAVKIQITYVNNSGVTTGTCWASFVGIAW